MEDIKMKKMIFGIMMFFIIANAFASTMLISPNRATHKKTMKREICTVDSLVINQNEDTKELLVKGNGEIAINMKDVSNINFLAGKNSNDKVSFYVNGDKYTYRLSDIKSIKIRTINRN